MKTKTKATIERCREANSPVRVEIERFVNGAWELKTFYDVKPGDRINITLVEGESFKAYEV